MTKRPGEPAHRSVRDEIADIVSAESGRIINILEGLHANPELSGREERASELLMAELERDGFEVECGTAGLPTAFVARRACRGTAGPAGANETAVGILLEYDALPGMGHGCGHNLIAAAGLGAGLAAGRLVDRIGGEVRVYGTPAEETIGGKVVMAGRGAFDGLDAAMMVHPAHEHRAFTDSLACRSVEVKFHGREAHAVAHPDKGINALDAVLQLFQAVDHLRRAARRDVHIPGVILKGGDRPNVIPAHAVAQFSIRSATAAERDRLVERFRRAVDGIAASTGCRGEIRYVDNAYDEMVTNQSLSDVYREHLVSEGIEPNDAPREHKGSLDMGNVSYRVPSIHPYVAIVSPDVASHTGEFAAATVSDAGRAGTLLSARALATTAVAVLGDENLRDRVRTEFRAFRERAEQERGTGFDRDTGEYILERP